MASIIPSKDPNFQFRVANKKRVEQTPRHNMNSAYRNWY